MPPLVKVSPNQSASILFERTSPEDIKYREVIVLVDGSKAGTLRFGEIIAVTILPGTHTVQAKNGLYSSALVAIEATSGSSHHFEVGNILTGIAAALMLIGPMPPKVFLRPKKQ